MVVKVDCDSYVLMLFSHNEQTKLWKEDSVCDLNILDNLRRCYLKDKDISSRINLSPHLREDRKLPTLPAWLPDPSYIEEGWLFIKRAAELIAMDPPLQ